jgi:hypothetical protein
VTGVYYSNRLRCLAIESNPVLGTPLVQARCALRISFNPYTKPNHAHYHSSFNKSAVLSATAYTLALKWAAGIMGKTLASTTLNPSTP